MSGPYLIYCADLSRYGDLRLLDDPQDEPGPEEAWRDAGAALDGLGPLLDRIPQRERDVLELLYRRGKTQDDIAHIMGLTQAAVSYLAGRGIERLRFLVAYPAECTAPDCEAVLGGVLGEAAAAVVALYLTTTCQTSVAARLGLKLSCVRERIHRALRRLQRKAAKGHPEYEPYAVGLGMVIEHGLVLHTYPGPTGSRRSTLRLQPAVGQRLT